MGRLLPLLLVALAGCRTVRPEPEAPRTVVRAFSVAFPAVGQALLEVDLELPAEVDEVRQVTWALAVRGAPFATGVEGAPAVGRRGPGALGVALHVPLVVKHVGWSEGSTFVEVAVRGEVEARAHGVEVRLPWAARREVVVAGVPLQDVRD